MWFGSPYWSAATTQPLILRQKDRATFLDEIYVCKKYGKQKVGFAPATGL